MASRLLEKIQQMENSRGVTLNEWNRMAAEVHAEAEAKVRKDNWFSDGIYFIFSFLVGLYSYGMIFLLLLEDLGCRKIDFLPQDLLRMLHMMNNDEIEGNNTAWQHCFLFLAVLILLPIAFHIITKIIAKCLPAALADICQNAKASTGDLDMSREVLQRNDDFLAALFIKSAFEDFSDLSVFGKRMVVLNSLLPFIFTSLYCICIWNLQGPIEYYFNLVLWAVVIFLLTWIVMSVFFFFRDILGAFGYKRISTRIKRLSDSYYDHLTSKEAWQEKRKIEKKAESRRREEKKWEEERKERSLQRVASWSVTAASLDSHSSFDADSYVSKNCPSYRYGIAATRDIEKINNDSSLTSSQKEAAKSELRRKSDMYADYPKHYDGL